MRLVGLDVQQHVGLARVGEPDPDEPETINEDPYGEGWLVRIRLSDPGEADVLLNVEAYKAHVAEQ